MTNGPVVEAVMTIRHALRGMAAAGEYLEALAARVRTAPAVELPGMAAEAALANAWAVRLKGLALEAAARLAALGEAVGVPLPGGVALPDELRAEREAGGGR
jgi:hypothetical protein